MSDEYASDAELQMIRDWPHDDPHGVLDFVEQLWHNPEWGWKEFEGREGEEKMRVIYASTGGWSGNEEIMDSLRNNFLLYHQFFDTYRRGGHYIFMLPARPEGSGAKEKPTK